MCGQWSESEVNPKFVEIPKKSLLRDVIIGWCHHVAETEVMIGLRRHAMAAVAPDCVLVHGGEHFKTKYCFVILPSLVLSCLSCLGLFLACLSIKCVRNHFSILRR